MRIKLKCEQPPKIGDIKTEREFLLFPRVIDNNLVWLETVNVVYEYQKGQYFDDDVMIWFHSEEWVEIRKELIDKKV